MPGDGFEHLFAAAGIYPFACTLHPGMNGAVVVGDVAGAAMAGAGTTDDTDASDTTGTGASAHPASAAADGTRSADNALPFGLAALGGLALGVLLGAAAALAIARPRSGTGPATSSGSEPATAD
jgi:hypothetical protein